MLPEKLLIQYCEQFFGFGNRDAKIWFVGIEESGGDTERDIYLRLQAWAKSGNDLEDAPSFYPSSGNTLWHGESAKLQATWRQLIRLLLTARGKPANDKSILEYQRLNWGRVDGKECLVELLPLPSPNSTAWNYSDWSNLPWLKTRAAYQNYLALKRAYWLRQKIERHRPKAVVFYASTLHRIWAQIAGGEWHQAIPGKLMELERDGVHYYVTRHPRAECDEYFIEIGKFLRTAHNT